MPPLATIALTTNIAAVPGVGATRATEFRRLNIRSIADLLWHLPLRYEHELPEQTIRAAGEAIGPNHAAEANIAVRGELAAVKAPLHRRAPYQATLSDGTGTIRLAWFHSPWMRNKLHPGDRIIVSGKATRQGDYMQMVNPRWQKAGEDNPAEARGERLVPVYPASEALSSAFIAKTIESVLEASLPLVDDHFHEAFRRAKRMPELRDAFRMAHRPASEADVAAAHRRLAYDELFLLQLGVMLKRRQRRDAAHAPVLKHTPKIDEHIRARIPFTLTAGQESAVRDIVRDLKNSTPMNRLLQGDVGSGKTVVALYAMLTAVASRQQAALMAPTELLAEQHFSSITDILQGARVGVELLTGSLKGAARRELLGRLERGEIDILVGTHALLTESVNFHSLAVAVIDEQHRFGVHQRATLRAKSGDDRSTPHVLVMTATPIPRTLSLTIFGDLDISTIKGLPPGRKPIATRHVPQVKAGEVYAYVAKQIRAGAQAYIVVPVIDESESGLKAVNAHLEWLKRGPLPDATLAAMHGRLDRQQRETIMDQFRTGKISALVATTVIEVGVDVPNASIMVIEQADRFGMAQLHQLRGRVGRGPRRSLCVLVADPSTAEGAERVKAIVSTTDGFAIAEKDMELRGPGELFGSRQSGVPPFRVAELPRDMKLLTMARRDAAAWVVENPDLGGERDAQLRRRLLKTHGKWLGLGDVA